MSQTSLAERSMERNEKFEESTFVAEDEEYPRFGQTKADAYAILVMAWMDTAFSGNILRDVR